MAEGLVGSAGAVSEHHLLGSRGGRPPGIVIHGYYLSFPVLQIAVSAAVATAALPYLAGALAATALTIGAERAAAAAARNLSPLRPQEIPGHDR